MSYKRIIITYWVINLLAIIGVYIQKDETAKSSALYWLLYASIVFVIATLATILKNRKK